MPLGRMRGGVGTEVVACLERLLGDPGSEGIAEDALGDVRRFAGVAARRASGRLLCAPPKGTSAAGRGLPCELLPSRWAADGFAHRLLPRARSLRGRPAADRAPGLPARS